MAQGMHLCGGSTAPTHSLRILLCLQHDPNGLLRALLVDGCDLEKSLAKVFCIIVMAVEDLFIERCPLLVCVQLTIMGHASPQKSRHTKPVTVIFDGLAI